MLGFGHGISSSGSRTCRFHSFKRKALVKTTPPKKKETINPPSKETVNALNSKLRAHGKLEKIARPFTALLSVYNKSGQARMEQKAQLTKTTSQTLGFGLKDADLKIINANERVTLNLKRIVSLEMCSQLELKRHRIHEAMEMFCRRVNDTGSPEVQAAIWSVKIAALENHVKQYRHDYVAERKITEYKDQRRKILCYLKRVSLERYYSCLDRLGLPHDLVEAAQSRFPRLPMERPKSIEGLKKMRAEANQ